MSAQSEAQMIRRGVGKGCGVLVARLVSELEKAIGDEGFGLRIIFLVPLSEARDNDLAIFGDDGAVG